MSDFDFDDARRAIASSHLNASGLCEPFLRVLPIDGAAVSVLAGPIAQSTIYASDATAMRLDELQFDLGEGPCWTALATRLPVLAPHMAEDSRPEWALFSEALQSDDAVKRVSGMFAFPLAIGSLAIGAIDFYTVRRGRFDALQVENATVLARLVAWQVLRRVFGDSLDDSSGTAHLEDDHTGTSRRVVHQATGMVLAQLGVSAEHAALLLRAHAYSAGLTVRELATEVVERRFRFD